MQPINILLVDDSLGDLRLIQEALKEVELSVEYQLHMAHDGIEALQKLGDYDQDSSTEIDLIILDLNMPRMDGREFLEIIKNRKNQRDIPVIVLTTSSTQSDILEAYRLNANCYVVKPIDINEFIDTVQKLSDFWMSVVSLSKTA